MKGAIAVLTLLMSVGSLMAAADGEPAALRNNPFSRPPSEGIAAVAGSGLAEITAAPSLELHATMIGTTKKLANVDGNILTLGDEMQGYVLVAIHERHVVFERDGKQTTVYVKPPQVETDE